MEINSDLIMQYGLMSKMSTGNTLLDTLLVMLVPLLVNRLMPYINEWFHRIFNRPVKPAGATHERVIVHKQKSNSYWWYGSDEDTPNHKLQQAILLYLNTVPGLVKQLESANVQLCKAKRNAAALDGSSSEDASDDGCSSSDCSDSDSEWYPGSELEEFEVKMVPPRDTWIDVEEGLRFMRSEAAASTDKDAETIITYTLVGKTAEQVDEFISRAYDAYRAMLKGEQQEEKANRYLYLPVLMGGGGGDDGDGDAITYRRYKLSDDKSFDNLFHPEKDTILGLVESFAHKRGKFAIPGYPHKLGFLLHGPPGTGKTSFIKALATHTKRSIINIPLARIKTNQKLMDIMFDGRVKVEGIDMRVPLPFHKVIYVMEDVDAASHVVNRRLGPGELEASLAGLTAGKTATTTKATAGAGEAQDASSASPNGAASPVQGPAPKLTSAAAAAAALLGGGYGNCSGSDELNLAGLLNVLDGVVDTPGRIVVMSTNHPEKLDPALIRPGRINKKVYMGHIAGPQAVQMVRHYFGEISKAHQQQLLGSWVDGVVSPAALEALCAEYEEVEELLAAVQQLVEVAGAAASSKGSVSSNSSSSSKVEVAAQQQEQQHEEQQERKKAEAECSSGCSSPDARCVVVRASSCAASFITPAASPFSVVTCVDEHS